MPLNFHHLKGLLPPPEGGLLGLERLRRSAVMAILFEAPDGLSVLLTRRAAGIPQGGEFCLPGGSMDLAKDSGPEECAKREAREEVGAQPDSLLLLGRLGTLVAPMGAVVDCVVAWRPQGLKGLKAAPEEVAEMVALPLISFLETPKEYEIQMEVRADCVESDGRTRWLLPVRELGLPDRYLVPWGRRRQRVLVFPTEHGPIWGLTAELLHALAHRLAPALRPKGPFLRGESDPE
jgi:8-oxo-dGTP pyrophosphatase MutT (NUDIX family)